MSDLPDGTVTFLFTDIEGSTRLWEEQPIAMRLALARHDEIAASIVSEFAGTLVKSRGEGDSLFAVFARTADAVAASLALQSAFTRETWPESVGLHVRAALHTGDAGLLDGDYYGQAVNRCARLRAIGHGGQIVLSDVTRELCRDSLPGGCTVKPLGEHRLRDLGRAESVFQLCHPDLPQDFPPLRSLGSLPNNLPQQLSTFIGREKEMGEIKALLSKSRLVTLTGSGGVGKSRLSLQVGADLLDRYAGGVWLVDLAPLSDPSLVPQAVAQELGVRGVAGRSLTQALTDDLKPRTLLLLLDNCEHLLSACAQLAHTLLRACPDLRVLASSREALGVSGEQSYRLPSLSLPALAHLPPAREVAQFEAVQLFVQRAALVQPSFAVTDRNALAVAQVCSRLDGIPLAIELAAARVRALPVEQIAARIDDRFRLLTGGSRDALPRQQTLRALIDWSYDLLNDQEKALLQRLSVFAGGWPLDAAEAACAGGGLGEWEVLDLLSSLVDKSLVAYEEPEEEGGQARYRLLETVRQYARDRLLDSGEGAAVRARHRDHFLALAEEAAHDLEGLGWASWIGRLERERDNLRAALEWSMGEQDRPDAEVGARAGLRLAVALEHFWHQSPVEYRSLGRQYLADLLARVGAAGLEHTELHARAHYAAGLLAYDQGDHAMARANWQTALAIWQGLGNEEQVDLACRSLGQPALNLDDFQAARSLLEQSLGRCQKRGDMTGTAHSLHSLGILAEHAGDYRLARTFYEECLPLFRVLGHLEKVNWVLHGIGFVACREGEFSHARTRLAESLRVFLEVGHHQGMLRCLGRFGTLAAAQGQSENRSNLLSRAARLFGAEQGQREAMGMPLQGAEQPMQDRDVEAARRALGEETWAAAWAEGRVMTLEQAVAYALEDE